ncbi:cilia- and flagella-associated protein 77 [Pundamilia nyererei]|uniref:Cilia- and flagella-associated protein 77 n=1 Tax=Pundamilia nyererei TaxID=303518 RepID=A0A9Y6JKG9_9CICH|nr:PREDICTED: uncharacterized protein C9orf171 homolog [Pundamilia nyererei]
MSSSPRVGVVRRSMLTDPLLIKAPLGRSRSKGFAVPGPDFTFGTSSNWLRDGGVAEALSSWNVQPRQEESAAQHADFVSLNREAVKSGMVTPKELSQYRAQRAQSSASKLRHGRLPRCRDQVPDITFGVRNRPSSPMSDVLSHQYAQRWLHDQLKNQTNNLKCKTKPGCIPDTRTSFQRLSIVHKLADLTPTQRLTCRIQGFGPVGVLLPVTCALSALSSWNVQPRQEESAAQHADFVSLNREAVKSGMVTPKELSQYRAQRAQSSASKLRHGRLPRCRDQVPDITFGVRNRPSSPMSDVLSHQYAQRWLHDQLKNQTNNLKCKTKPGCIPDTRTSLLRRSKSLPVIETPPKPARFAQVGPALDTFRDQETRVRAFGARRSSSQTQRSVLRTARHEEPGGKRAEPL